MRTKAILLTVFIIAGLLLPVTSAMSADKTSGGLNVALWNGNNTATGNAQVSAAAQRTGDGFTAFNSITEILIQRGVEISGFNTADVRKAYESVAKLIKSGMSIDDILENLLASESLTEEDRRALLEFQRLTNVLVDGKRVDIEMKDADGNVLDRGSASIGPCPARDTDNPDVSPYGASLTPNPQYKPKCPSVTVLVREPPVGDDLFILEPQKQIVSFVPEAGFAAHIMVLGQDGRQMTRFALPPFMYALAVRPDFAFGDLDNDGVVDILLLRTDPAKNVNTVYIFNPATNKTSQIDTYLLDNAIHKGVVLGDIDEDGYQDIIMGSSRLSMKASVSAVSIRYGSPVLIKSWTISVPEKPILKRGEAPEIYPTLADMDGDGKTEIIIPSADGKGFIDLGIKTKGRIDWPIYLHDSQRTAAFSKKK